MDRMAAGISKIQSGPFTRERTFHLLGLFLLIFQRNCYLPLCFNFVLYPLHEESAFNYISQH